MTYLRDDHFKTTGDALISLMNRLDWLETRVADLQSEVEDIRGYDPGSIEKSLKDQKTAGEAYAAALLAQRKLAEEGNDRFPPRKTR